MAGHLNKLRKGIVNGCNLALLGSLLDELQDNNVLNQAEVEHINGEYATRSDKCRALIDMIKAKGDGPSTFLLQKLVEHDPMLAEKLGLTGKQPTGTAMNSGHLNKLRKGIVNGCNLALLGSLLDELQDNNVLKQAEVEHINGEYATRIDKCRALIDMIMVKGDGPSTFLLQKLVEHDPMLAENLGLTGKQPTETSRNPEVAKPSALTQEQKTNSDMKSVIHCTDEEMKRICDFHGEMIYEVRKPKGRKRLALLICNESFTMLKERTGAQVDQNGMIKLLNELGYQVQLEKNLNSQNMLKVMKDFAAREEHLDSDSTFIVLMSHGEKDGICGTESHFSHTAKGQVVTDLLHFDHIFSTFNNINCAKLRNKPKVIIIQACRGHQDGRVLVSDDVALQGDDPMEDDAMKFVQRETDFVCFYSTTPDTVSWRHPNTGSLFIQCLIEKMNELAHCESLVDIFFKVQSSFAGKLQMPTQERKTLTKKFYLFPGH